MGCGCKNKNNGGQQAPQPVQSPQNASNNQTIQESIRKVVDKYYKNKK